MDIEPGWDDEDEEEIGEDGEKKTRQSKRSKGSKKSAARSWVSKWTTKTKLDAKSRASWSSRRSGISRITGRSWTTTTALSKRQDEDPAPQFLSVNHYDKLFRIHSMLAMIAPDSAKEKELALDA